MSSLSDVFIIDEATGRAVKLATPGRKKFFQYTVPKPPATERIEEFHAVFGCTCATGRYADDEAGGFFESVCHAIFPSDSELLDPLNLLLLREALGITEGFSDEEIEAALASALA